ncbi:CHY zinc finger protein [Geomicrobium sp. JSM 1781026]|uniref:CHY zinc finger protein n=1 Tax=Geomicrobium sp. JSM 1781026 TaxID=3344580 RepID=UPI0035C18034
MIHIHGQVLDEETRCVHYDGPTDIIAIKFACCGRYYPCIHCHEESESHRRRTWATNERDERAIYCGACKTEHTIQTYMNHTHCPRCSSLWNENCKYHYHYYFEEDHT